MRTKKNKAETVEEVNEAVHLMHKKIEAIKHHHGTESSEESGHHSHKEADNSSKHHGKPAHHHKSEDSKEHKSCENSEKKVTENNSKSSPIVDMINGLVKDAVSSNSSSKSQHKLDKLMNESIANRVHGLNDKQ